ncbi:MAG: chemotaxis protein CheW, partial [Microcoleus sp. SIO2G3]|nr:chemotaxis protein CheW [Microcoleus sp. SIO2G3]
SFDLFTLDDPLPPESRERLLRFPLGNEDSALLPLAQIAEIFRVNVEDILPVPEMPSCVLGICNWRGEMLWLVDLDQLLGYPPLYLMADAPMAIVVQASTQPLGLVVSQVNDLELHDLQKLTNAVSGLFPPKLLPFVLGALPSGSGTVLNAAAITQCPLWQLHRGEIS